MNLELATVQSCHDAGCRVRLVGHETLLDTRYSEAVLNRIRIRRGDLIAVDLAVDPPQLVWRWRCGEVLQPLSKEPAHEHVIVGSRGCAIEARVTRPDLKLQPGDIVWLSGHAEGAEIVDLARDGEPENADWIRRTYFNLIEDEYAAMDRRD